MWRIPNSVPSLIRIWQQHKRIISGLMIGAVVLHGLLRAVTAQQTIAYADYLRLIGNANMRAQAVVTQSPTECQTVLAQIADELTAVSHVQFPDGTLMPVNHAGADHILRASPCNPQQAVTYLTGICPIHICPVDAQPAEDPTSTEISDSQSAPPPQLPPESSDTQPAPDNVTGAQADLAADGTGSLPETTGIDQPADEGAGDAEAAGEPPATDEDAPPAAPPADAAYPAAGSGDNAAEAYPAGTDENASGETAVSPETRPNETTGSETTSPTESEQPTQTNPDAESPAPGEQPAGETAVSNPAPTPTAAEAAANAPAVTDNNNGRNRQILAGVLLLLSVLLLGGGILLWRQWRAQEDARRQRQQKPATPKAAVDEGRRQIEEGEYREAVRQLFLATLLVLEDRGLLQYDKSLTNRELLQKMQANPGLLNTLHFVVASVERVWYGFEPLTKLEFEALVAKINSLQWAPV